MIISGNQSGVLPFLKQLPAAYMDPLNFSFQLDINGLGKSLDFGLGGNGNTKPVSYSLRSGLVYDYTGRLAGTYQSGINSFYFNYYGGQAWQYINDRLISVDSYPNYTGNPFQSFFINNKSPDVVDFDLSIKGFSPPSIYSSLTGAGPVSGEIIQSGLDTNPGQGVLYQIFDISVPTGYGIVTFESSGTGGIKYSLSGGSYAPDDIIPVTFNTYWGNFTKDIVVSTTAITGGPITTETGIYLSLYGERNTVLSLGSLDFFVDYYSNAAFPVTIELSGSGASSIVNLSGTGEGLVTYQGNVFGSGTIFAAGPATGTADLFAIENASYNTQFTVLDQYLNITAPNTEFVSKYTPFIGDYTVIYSGVPIEGTYDGPSPAYIGKMWKGTGDVTVVYSFSLGDNGVIVDAASYPGTGNPNYASGRFSLKYGTNYVEYPYNPATYPTGEAYGYIENTVTGQGVVTITEVVDFFGYGLGRVASGTSFVPATGTGQGYYTGDTRDWLPYYEYDLTYGDGPVYPDLDFDSIITGGALVRCQNQYYIGTTNYQGLNVRVTGNPASPEYTWGYPTGPAYLDFGGGSTYVERFLDVSGIIFTPPSGDPITGGFTGMATGHIEIPPFSIPGPVFPHPRDTGLYPYASQNGVSGNAVYGRGCILGYLEFSFNSIGASLGGGLPVTFDLQDGSYFGQYTDVYNDPSESIFVNNAFPQKRDGGFANYILRFVPPEFGFFGPTGTVFTGFAKVPTDSIASIFRLEEGFDETGPLEDYNASGWINGDRLVRPSPQIFGSGSDARYLKVTYLSNDQNSVDSATLRVSGGGVLAEIEITGNPPNGV